MRSRPGRGTEVLVGRENLMDTCWRDGLTAFEVKALLHAIADNALSRARG
jgi:hypothetical protein